MNEQIDQSNYAYKHIPGRYMSSCRDPSLSGAIATREDIFVLRAHMDLAEHTAF